MPKIKLLAHLLLCIYCVKGTSSAETASNNKLITQRADSVIIMPAEQAQTIDDYQTWEIDIEHPGNYTVELITDISKAKNDHHGALQLNGEAISNELKKAYIIEEGLVSQFIQPATITKSGKHTISTTSDLPLIKARMVPQGYTQTRIHISSDKYYEPWHKMHQSPEKVAAMDWYKKARFGMFIHWGVYSNAAGSWKGEPIEKGQGPKVAEWIMYAFQIPREEYKEYAKNFNPDKSFAENIAKLARDTGMKYVVITAKHHDGFALFDSKHSKLDITDATDYAGDLIKELYDACRAEGLEFGVYYSHGKDWGEGTDSNYANAKKHHDQYGVPTLPNGINLWDPSPHTYHDYLNNKAYAQIEELIKLLPDLRLIWFDGDGLITEAQAFRFYKMIYDLNPNIIVSRRVGYNFGDYVDAGDNKTPAANELAAKHFETCGTANHSWGFKAHDHAWQSSNQLLRNFIDIVSKGGNYLLNIGPDGKGTVPQPCVESFLEMGKWVKAHEEALLGTSRWHILREGVTKVKDSPSLPTEFWFSAKKNKVYAISLTKPPGTINILSLKKSAGKISNVALLNNNTPLKWKQTETSLEVDLTEIPTSSNGYALEVTFQ